MKKYGNPVAALCLLLFIAGCQKEQSDFLSESDTASGNSMETWEIEAAESGIGESEISTTELTDTPDYEMVSVTEAEGTLSLEIPNGWQCEIYPKGSDALTTMGEFGLHFYPEGVTEGFIEVAYVNFFGVCGTGLEEKEITLAGNQAFVGTYDNQEYWSFISLEGKNIVALTCSVDDWFSEYEEQILDILDTLDFE